MKRIASIFFGLICFLLAVACHETQSPEPESETDIIEVPEDTLSVIDHLEERGVLRAVTNRPYLNYCLLEGRPAGFQFELLDDFSEILDLQLDLKTNDSLPEWYQMLLNDEVDIAAIDLDTIINDSILLSDSVFHYTIFQLPVTLDRTFAWVVLNQDDDSTLVSAIDLWLEDYQRSDLRKSFYRYFNGRNVRSDSSFKATTRISQYDNLIRAEARKIGWDWRLLASIIYQESHFKPDLESEMGAYGLMQLMPVTMDKYGVDYDSSVEEQLAAGGKLLLHFDHNLPESISDSLEREKFMLACYNAGMGHVLESRIAAERHGKDPNLWTDNVEFFGPKQTYYFVKEVTKRFSHYKALIE